VSDSVITGNTFAPGKPENVALRIRGGSGNLVETNLVRGGSEIDPGSRLRKP
jgi:hypothetical protein